MRRSTKFSLVKRFVAILLSICHWHSIVLAYGIPETSDSLIERYFYEATIRPTTTAVKLKKILEQSLVDRDTSAIIQSLYLLAQCEEILLNADSAQTHLDRSRQWLNTADKNSINHYNWHHGYADMLQLRADFKGASQHLDTAFNIVQSLQDRERQWQVLLKKSYALGNLGAFDECIKVISEADELIKELNDHRGQQELHIYMKNYYHLTGEHEKSTQEAIHALNAAIELKDTVSIIFARQNLLAEYALSNINLAEDQFLEIQAISQHVEIPINKKAQLNYGAALINHAQYTRGKKLLEDCLDYFSERDDFRRLVFIHHWVAIAHRGLDQYDMAAVSSKRGYDLAVEKGYEKLAEISSYTLYQTYVWRDNFQDGLNWYLKSSEHRDSIYVESLRKEMTALEIKYETFRKEQELTILKTKEEAVKSKMILLIIGLVLSILSGILVINSIAIRRKKDKDLYTKKQNIQIVKQNSLRKQLDFKQRELVTKALQLAKKNALLYELETEVKKLSTTLSAGMVNTTDRISTMINNDQPSREDWKQFVEEFKIAHPDFVDNLYQQFNKFTPSEMRLITLLRMNLASKEIANILRISDQGVWKSRYRIRKKMGLAADIDLQETILCL